MGVTSDSHLVITIGSAQAGGTEGQLILDDVEFNKSRDNDLKHGVGNDTPQGIQYGNITFDVSASAQHNGASASLARDLDPYTPVSGTLVTTDDADGTTEVNFGKLDWNDISVEAQDGGDVMVSVEFDGREPAGDFGQSE